MNKFLFVIFAICCVSALGKKKVTGGEVDFFLGFSSIFGLEDAGESLLTCAGVDKSSFLVDLRKVLTDLGKGKLHPALSDLFHVLDDIKELQEDCIDGAVPFVVTFGPAIEAWRHNPAEFYVATSRSLASSPIETLKLTYKLTFDVKSGAFRKGGEDFGTLAHIALSSYLSSNSIIFALEYFGEEYHLGDDKVSTNNALDFFYGFSSAFGLSDAAHKLVACGKTDTPTFVKGLQALIKDIKRARWGAVVGDGIEVYHDIQQLKADCPAGALPFVKEFSPAVVAYEHDKHAFVTKLRKNVTYNLPKVMSHVGKMITDFKKKNYQDAGAQFGAILHLTLGDVIQL